MLTTTIQIDRQTLKDFTTLYPIYKKLETNTELWDALISCASNPTSINAIVAANNQLGMPPTEAFIRWLTYLTPWQKIYFSDYEKRGIGAYWGYIFEKILLYQGHEYKIPVNYSGIVEASRYTLSNLQNQEAPIIIY